MSYGPKLKYNCLCQSEIRLAHTDEGPPRNGVGKMRPTACTVRGDGASLLIERCVRYSRSRKIAADDEDAARRTRQRGQDIPAGSSRSPFHNIRSATEIAARLADPECSSPEGGG